jgi:hypothetical protein
MTDRKASALPGLPHKAQPRSKALVVVGGPGGPTKGLRADSKATAFPGLPPLSRVCCGRINRSCAVVAHARTARNNSTSTSPSEISDSSAWIADCRPLRGVQPDDQAARALRTSPGGVEETSFFSLFFPPICRQINRMHLVAIDLLSGSLGSSRFRPPQG